MSDLTHIKAGDELAINRLYGSGVNLHKVDRVTATQIICGNIRIRRTDGHVVGTSGFRSRSAFVLTEEQRENLAQVERFNNARARFRAVVVTLDNLERVEAFLKSLDDGN